MAKQATSAGSSNPGVVTRTRTFFQEVRTEMDKVTWPSQADLKASTSVVLLFLGLMAVIVGAMDKIFEVIVLWVFRLT